MIRGTGVDIVEIERIKKAIKKNNRFINKIFSENEIEYSESKYNKFQHFAARFASKEAFFKALGTGWRNGMSWTDIEIINNSLGKPEIKLFGETEKFFNESGLKTITVSISHSKDYAVAFVIIEG